MAGEPAWCLGVIHFFPDNLSVSFEFLARMPDGLRPGHPRQLKRDSLVFALLVVASAIVLSVPAGTKTKPALSFVGHNTSRVDGADRHLDRHLDRQATSPHWRRPTGFYRPGRTRTTRLG